MDEESEFVFRASSSQIQEPVRGLGYEFFNAMKRNRSKIAQYLVDSGETDTYGHLLQRSIRTAIKLKEKALTPEDVICICSSNQVNNMVPFIASLFLNIKVASLDPTLSLLDTTHLLKQVQPKVLFIQPSCIELIEVAVEDAGVECDIVVFGKTDQYEEFEDYLERREDEMDFEPVDPESVFDTAVIFFSSGTTGLPKGICIHHYGIYVQATNLIQNGYITAVTQLFSSLYWISAVLITTACIISGTAKVICSHFDPKELWTNIEKYKITYLFTAPTQAIAMLKAGRPEDLDTTNLLAMQIGGGAISVEFIKSLRDLLPGTIISQVYGQTEVAGVLSCFNLREVQDTLFLHYRLDSVGRPLPGITYKVVDLETEESCGPNKRGELRVKSKLITNGYYNMDSSSTFDAKGWLRTGDVVYYDEDFCFYVVDRIKEMLKYKSWHVAPSMLENFLCMHPAVKSVVVIGIPDEEDGDHAMGVLVLNENYDESVVEDILEFFNGKVDERQRLWGGIKVIGEIPLTSTGKVKRNYLRGLILSGKL